MAWECKSGCTISQWTAAVRVCSGCGAAPSLICHLVVFWALYHCTAKQRIWGKIWDKTKLMNT